MSIKHEQYDSNKVEIKNNGVTFIRVFSFDVDPNVSYDMLYIKAADIKLCELKNSSALRVQNYEGDRFEIDLGCKRNRYAKQSFLKIVKLIDKYKKENE